jgi:hypothetical protein
MVVFRARIAHRPHSSCPQRVFNDGHVRARSRPDRLACFIVNVVDNEAPESSEALPNLIAHLFAKLLPASRPLLLIDVPPVKNIEIFRDRIVVTGHRENKKELSCRPARSGDFPSADRVGGVVRLKSAELCQVGDRKRPTDRVTEILAKLFQFGASHVSLSLSWCAVVEVTSAVPRGVGCGF